jgi:16S rRNA (cytosine1402-N4)-methyltransferase
MAHVPVLLQEVITGLALREGEVLVDATVNRGGHSQALCPLLGASGYLIGLDADAGALEVARERLASCPSPVKLVETNFRQLAQVLEELEVPQVDAFLFDLGISSEQLDESGRGFSFQRDEPLMMTLPVKSAPGQLTATDIVNTWPESDLAVIFTEYGEEGFAKQIAAAIVWARKNEYLVTTQQLVEVIAAAVPEWYKHKRRHFATQTFQALRMAVNDELGSLESALVQAWDKLALGGRLAVITFHSLEARLVKNFFKAKKADGVGEWVEKRAVRPGRAEIVANPRSRSAQLRIIKKIA